MKNMHMPLQSFDQSWALLGVFIDNLVIVGVQISEQNVFFSMSNIYYDSSIVLMLSA